MTFPQDIYNQLLGVDFRLLDELTFLSRKQAQRSPTGARYCFPSRAYLAAKLGCCVRTVSRSVARLKRLGILDAIQRRPVRGQWKTNLYRVRHWLGWRVGQCQQMLRKPLARNRETPVARIASRERELRTPKPQPVTKNNIEEELMARWQSRGWIAKD